jgi:hypothetical protein
MDASMIGLHPEKQDIGKSGFGSRSEQGYL